MRLFCPNKTISMKRILTAIFLMIAGTAIFSGCKKSDSSPSYKMTATLASTAFNNTSFSSDSSTFTAGSGSGWVCLISSGGISTTGVGIKLYLYTYNGVGTYSLDGSGSNYQVGTVSYDGNVSGSITITSVSSTAVSGTFYFTGESNNSPITTVTVSNGSFTAKVQ